MEHRSSDTTDVTVKWERKIRFEWVAGGCLIASTVFGGWAWNISLTLNNVSRDLAAATKTLEKLELGLNSTQAELTRGTSRDELMANRVADAERRITSLETKVEARQAARQQATSP